MSVPPLKWNLFDLLCPWDRVVHDLANDTVTRNHPKRRNKTLRPWSFQRIHHELRAIRIWQRNEFGQPVCRKAKNWVNQAWKKKIAKQGGREKAEELSFRVREISGILVFLTRFGSTVVIFSNCIQYLVLDQFGELCEYGWILFSFDSI